MVLASLVVVLVLDRSDRAEQAEQAATAADRAAPGATLAAENGPAAGELPPVEAFTQEDRPALLSGTMYALTDEDSLVELDLLSGKGRRARLGFDAAPWLVSQVVALEETVLISSRREVYAVDRATLQDQQLLAADRWVVSSPRRDWAALVPFGAGGGAVTVVDGAGVALAEQRLVLPSGVAVHGAVADALVIDNGSGLQLLGLDGVARGDLGAGRFLAAGAEMVARMRCQALSCVVATGAPGSSSVSEISGVVPAGPWLFGPVAAFDPRDRLLATIAATAVGALQVQVHDTAAPGSWTGPVPPRSTGGLPAVAWSADGQAVVFASSQGVVLWRPALASARSSGGDSVTVPMPGAVLSLTVTPDPPPPPPIGGPPPSFA